MNLVEDRVEDNPWLQTAASSILGTRQYQQDYAYLYTDASQVLGVVCDGMGGLNGGEMASMTAVRLLAKEYSRRNPAEDIPAFFQREADAMDQEVAELTNDRGEPLRAGTTVVAVSIQGNKLYWLSVGDSKIYIIRNKEIKAVTREHNYRLTLQEGLAKGTVSRETYEIEDKSRQAEALTSYLGMGGLKLIDKNQVPFVLADGDIVLLCSDGLYKSLDESQICAMVRDNDIDMKIAAERLTAMALEQALCGQDNTSVILMAYQNP